jgi:hypothetical protein
MMSNQQDAGCPMPARHVAAARCRGLPEACRATTWLGRTDLNGSRILSAIRKIIGGLLLSVACCATVLAQEDALPRAILDDGPRLSSPLALDVDRQLRTARGIEHDLSLEQSRVNARSTSLLQRYQTERDIQVSRQNLDTLKTEAPQARSIPLLERRLDRVSRPTGAISRNPGLESGFSTSLGLGSGAGTSLGLSGSIGGG